MDMKKKEYTKPSIKLVEWEFSNAICQKIVTNSPTQYINVTKGTATTVFENRDDINAIGDCNRVGSR